MVKKKKKKKKKKKLQFSICTNYFTAAKIAKTNSVHVYEEVPKSSWPN